jgi:cytochrome P450
MQTNESALGEDFADGVSDAIVWDDDVQRLWERLRTGPAVRGGGGGSIMVSPTAVDEYLHLPTVMSSNPDAVFLGSETGLIPLQVDPPDHVRYRRMLDPLFTPPKMAKLEAEVAALVNQRIDSFIEQGACDLASELAVPIPCGTFLRLLGLPIERLDEFIAMKDNLIRPTSTATEDATAIRARAGAWVFALFGDALDERAAQPTDDVIGHLVRLEQAGELTREESLNTRIRPRWTSCGTPSSISPSGWASTDAWAPISPAWSSGSRWASGTAVYPPTACP